MRMDIKFTALDRKIDFSFRQDDLRMDVDFGEVHEITNTDEIPTYEGNYEVIPKVDSQTLTTSQRLMTDDLTVLAIPYAEVSNIANGITVTIG